MVRTGPTRRSRCTASVRFLVNAPGPGGEPIMTRTLKGSLLIASMLVVLWATTSEACHRRRAAAPATCYSSGYSSVFLGVHLRGPHGLLRRRGRLRHGWRGLLRRRVCRRHGRLSRHTGTTTAGPATTRAASAGRRPGWASGPAWASAHRVWVGRGRGRPRRAGVRDRGAARPGRRRLGPGALTVPRFSDHPAGARRPGPTGSLGDGDTPRRSRPVFGRL